MRDIPIFTSEYGVASLVLSQIPFKKEAYIRIQDSRDPQKLLIEAARFCRCAGGEKVFFTGFYDHPYPPYSEIWTMRCMRSELPDTDAALIPIQEHTVEDWRRIYNDRMYDVATASLINSQQGKQLLISADAYFVHRQSVLLGIGIASGENIHALASVVPGAGRDVLLALNHALSGEMAIVEVASTNSAALRLYKDLGFVPIRLAEKWYELID